MLEDDADDDNDDDADADYNDDDDDDYDDEGKEKEELGLLEERVNLIIQLSPTAQHSYTLPPIRQAVKI